MLTTALAPAATTTPVSSSRADGPATFAAGQCENQRVVPSAPSVALTSISEPAKPEQHR